MGGVLVVVVLVLVVKWRLGHRARRRSEAEFRQLAHRPMTAEDARFPADRRPERGVAGWLGNRNRLKW